MEFDPTKLAEMMQKAQSMQQKMMEALQARQVVGQAGGGMVKVHMNGALSTTKVEIDPTVVDKDDVAMLEDLVRAEVNDATARVEELRMNEAKGMAGQLGIPGGLF